MRRARAKCGFRVPMHRQSGDRANEIYRRATCPNHRAAVEGDTRLAGDAERRRDRLGCRSLLPAAFVLPIAASLPSLMGGVGIAAAALAALSMALGLVVERWLCFAEAEHVVMLYHGQAAARGL